jgi:hypothetical protein
MLNFFKKFFVKRSVSVKDFNRWLNTKNPNETYFYGSSSNCAFARYLKEVHGVKEPYVSCSIYSHSFKDGLNGRNKLIPPELVEPLKSRTFGELKRKLENA